MSQFTGTGRFNSRDGDAAVEPAIDADTADVVREHAYSRLGSQHGLTQLELDEGMQT